MDYLCKTLVIKGMMIHLTQDTYYYFEKFLTFLEF